MGNASEKQVEANRRNARRSSGPRTARGRAISRANSLKHGLAAEVLVPEQQQAAYRAALKRWEHETGPSDVVEHHLIRRAAVASVTLDRIDEAREETREQAARDAVKRWEKKKQHAARRKAQDLDTDPFGVVAELEATAFGCDWLIRQWQALDGPLAMGIEWSKGQLDKAQRLLGYPAGQPGPDAEPPVRVIWLLAGVLAPFSIGDLPRTPAEAGPPTETDHARAMLRRFVAEEVERLEGLRDEAWEAVEGPERRSVIVRAAAADTSKEGQLRHRYAKDADRSHNAAIRLFLAARGKRRQEYLAIAREARQSGKLPRVPAGGGWWHEVDCEPAPPGFARIDPVPPGAGNEPIAMNAGLAVGPVSVGSPIDDLPAPRPDGPTPPRPAPTPSRAESSPPAEAGGPPADPAPVGGPSPDAPRRIEPIFASGDAGNFGRNPHTDNSLRRDSPAGPINVPRRTEPPSGPIPGPGPTAPGAAPEGTDRPADGCPDPVGAMRRIEPISSTVNPGISGHKRRQSNELQVEGPRGPIGVGRRTEPPSGPDRPGHPPGRREPDLASSRRHRRSRRR